VAGTPKKRKRRQRLLIEGQASACTEVVLVPPEPPPEQPKKKRRPLDAEAFTDLCEWIASGKSLRSWATQTGYTDMGVIKWLQADPEGRLKMYREARRMQADAHIDQLIDLSDEPVPVNAFGSMDSAAVNDKRLRIDARKWIASKYHPGMYGERVAVEGTFKAEETPPDEIMKRIIGILATHGLRVVPAEPGTNEAD
jgi:hypothetical protein